MGHSLDRLASAAAVVDGVRVGDVAPGDCLFVRTRNSVYFLRVNGDGTFDVTFTRIKTLGAGSGAP